MSKLVYRPSLFESDSIAQYQFFHVFRAKANLLPEEKLMFAVLNDAVEHLNQFHGDTSRRGRALYRATREWVLSRESEDLYSFENICETLKIDPDYLRRGLGRWLEENPEKVRRLKVWRTPLRYRSRVGCFRVAS